MITHLIIDGNELHDLYVGNSECLVVNGNVELRYPFLQSIDLDGAVFFDVGQLMADLGDFDPGEFRATSGFGLRWVIADLLPLVVDYGAVLGRRPGEGFGRLHLNLGYTF